MKKMYMYMTLSFGIPGKLECVSYTKGRLCDTSICPIYELYRNTVCVYMCVFGSRSQEEMGEFQRGCFNWYVRLLSL